VAGQLSPFAPGPRHRAKHLALVCARPVHSLCGAARRLAKALAGLAWRGRLNGGEYAVFDGEAPGSARRQPLQCVPANGAEPL